MAPRLSHMVIASLNVLSLLWSILMIILTSCSMAKSQPTDCFEGSRVWGLLNWLFLLAVSAVGLVGAMREKRALLCAYVWALGLWILWLIGWSAVLYAVSEKAAAAEKHKEYDELEEYPSWLRRYAVGGKKWGYVKDCLVGQEVCRKLLLDMDGYDSAILYSCCEPPLHCGFVNRNDTDWEIPPGGLASQHPDCKAWNKDKVCYDCDSCKAGYIRIRREDWREEACSDLFFAIFLAIVFIIAFHGFKQAPNKEEECCNHPIPPPPTTNNQHHHHHLDA